MQQEDVYRCKPRDSKGKVLATLSTSKDYIIEHVKKAIETLRVAMFCRELGLQRVELEGDAL